MTDQLRAPLSAETAGDPNALRRRKTWISILVSQKVELTDRGSDQFSVGPLGKSSITFDNSIEIWPE
jgi:hypothetical protein